MSSTELPSFAELGLDPAVLTALNAVGYESPSPIQAQIIPHVLAGVDVIGQAQTGTGKTAAFALPILSRLDLKGRSPQALVLTPTRELAIQVAEAFQRYAAHLPGFHVLPIYGGQAYELQLKPLRRGVHVVVGTPGRVMDHIRRGSLQLDQLRCLVLDEADEMLRMGFIDDVEWILSETPAGRQVALFSATMPAPIRRIAQKHLSTPQEITVQHKASSALKIRQRVWQVSGLHKLDALTRILEVETFDGIIIFTRTKLATVELAEKLEARGHAAVAINGDMDQKARERAVEQFKAGRLDILVATDVVARGIDVDRVSHVINYDIPHDTESYVHRIGRTGRAGRSGEAILFVAPRERRMLYAIEKATGQRIEALELPTVERINDTRVERFKQRVSDTLASADLEFFRRLIEDYQREHEVPATEIAAALAQLLQGDTPLILPTEKKRKQKPSATVERPEGGAGRKPPRHAREEEDRVPAQMERFRLEVGSTHGVQPGNIVGALANEAGLDAQHIGRIKIFDDHSVVDLPQGMPKDIFQDLKKVWVSGRQLQISRLSSSAAGRSDGDAAPKPAHAGKKKPGKLGKAKSGSTKAPKKPARKAPKPPRKAAD